MSRIAKAAVVTLGTSAVVLSGAGLASADAGAEAKAVGSPGVLSGNVVQVPVNVPINLCGNTIDVIGLLNPAFGNVCVNKSDDNHKGNPGSPGPSAGYGH
ncbi:chaplin [Streptomyces caniscabiei]|uniref:chaplin n=1 Tax=Streptomyces TaxID=1883 RepID=UPI0029ACBA86|nr:chaplin [Streptomyces caniscabiei]MDX2598573.1 chaplin [Streptomyces caniscabiei]MDX2736035.1 chaplin [Streptomyces caniscabiei]MDX2782205.1 chaplin [Streptomyces caniscabiei]